MSHFVQGSCRGFHRRVNFEVKVKVNKFMGCSGRGAYQGEWTVCREVKRESILHTEENGWLGSLRHGGGKLSFYQIV